MLSHGLSFDAGTTPPPNLELEVEKLAEKIEERLVSSYKTAHVSAQSTIVEIRNPSCFGKGSALLGRYCYYDASDR